MMSKFVWIGLLCVLASGCGRGWLPIFRGAPCNRPACGLTAPAGYDSGCVGCGQAAGFGGYELGGESLGDGYYDGGVIVGGSYPSAEGLASPPMAPLPQSTPSNN